MPLRPSQVETLRVVADFPDGVGEWELAKRLGVSLRASLQRLERLARSGHLAIRIFCDETGAYCLYVLTQLGREALEGR